MKNLFSYADQFIKESNWKDLALIKFCLCAMGVLWGMALPKKAHKPVTIVAVCIFIGTYIPLMAKLFKIMGIIKPKAIEEE